MKEGYKKTEFGWIPEEWSIARLEDVCDKNEKYSFTGGPFGSDLKSCHYTDYGVQIVQLQNIGEGHFINDSRIYTSEEKADELKSCNIYPNDIIIAKMAEPVARACKIPNNQSRYLMCSDGIRVVIDKNNYNNDFVLYSINSNYFRNNAITNSTGSTRLRIGLSALRNLKLILPPIKEQEKIADILLTVDSQIDSTDRLIEKTEELKRGLMQRLLTKGIGHKEFKKSEFGEIPVKWEVRKLNDISEINPKKEVLNMDDSATFMSMEQVSNEGRVVSSGVRKYKEIYKGYSAFKNRDVLLAKITPCFENGKRAIVDNLINGVGFGSTEFHVLRADNKYSIPEFIYYYISTHNFRELAEANMTGSAGQKRVPTAFLKDIRLIVPSIEEQKEITNILSSVDAQIEEYENKKAKLEELKKGLMQQLLIGKIRVK